MFITAHGTVIVCYIDAVIVVDEEKFVAMGKIVDLPTIHGVAIPETIFALFFHGQQKTMQHLVR